MTHFFALDVETANYDFESICQIGVAEFRDEQIVNKWATLINPKDHFSELNIGIHGITPEMVKRSPVFPIVYPELKKMITGMVVVSHTPFDQGALLAACMKYDLPELSCTWLDSARIVRRHWQEFRSSGYGLSNIANFLKIEYKAHDALEDACAAGQVVIRAMQESNQSLDDWLLRAYKNIPSFPSSSPSSVAGNPLGEIKDETVVFTGSLSFPRNYLVNIASEAGFNVDQGVTKRTTILVVGAQDLKRLAGKEKSSKHLKAEALISEGHAIRIMSENELFNMLPQNKYSN